MSKEYQLANAADVTTFTVTEPVVLNDLQGFSIEAEFSSGTINGDLTLQARARTGLSWVTVQDSSGNDVTLTVVAGEASMFNVQGSMYREVRLAWSYTSGAGTMNVNAFIKENPIIGV